MADKRGEQVDIGVAVLFEDEPEELMTSGEMRRAGEKVSIARRTVEQMKKEREGPSMDDLMKVMMEMNKKFDENIRDLDKKLDKKFCENQKKMDIKFEEVKSQMIKDKEEILDIMDKKIFKEKVEVHAEIQHVNERINLVEERCDIIETRFVEQDVKIDKVEDNTEKIAKSRIRVAEDKINQRIDKNNQEIDEKIGSIKGDMEKFKKEQQEASGLASSIDWTSIDVGMLGNIKKDIIPTFVNDSTLHPVKYIENVKEIVAINFRNNYQVYHNKIIYLIKNTLKGEPKLWFNTVESTCTDFQKFVELFLKQYWGVYHQNKCRNKLILGRYDKNRVYKSRERYALEIYNESMYLEPRINEKDLLSRIADHFGEDIALQVVVKDMDSLGTLIEYLRRIDDKDNQVRQRRTNVEINNVQGNVPNRESSVRNEDNYCNNGNNYNYQRNNYNGIRRIGNRYNNNFSPGRYNDRNNNNRPNSNYERARGNFNNSPNRNMVHTSEENRSDHNQSSPIIRTNVSNERPQQNQNF